MKLKPSFMYSWGKLPDNWFLKLLGAFLGTCNRCIKKEYTQKEFSMLLPGALKKYAPRMCLCCYFLVH